ELAERRAGLEAEVLHETVPTAAVGGERVGLAAASVEREHELTKKAFPRGVFGHCRLERRHEGRPLAALELDVELLFERRHTKLLQFRSFGGERRDIGKRAAPPEGERVGVAALLDEISKHARIDRDVSVERVAVSDESDRVAADQFPKARDVGLHDLRRGGRW